MRYPDHIRDAVIGDYAEGHRVKDIAARHGVGTETVRLWARSAGLRDREGRGGYCACCKSARILRGGLCAPCRADIPLTGGRWVPRGGIVVWEPEMDVAS